MQVLQQKVIKITIKINDKEKTFTSENNSNKLSSDGLRVQAVIQYGAGNIAPTAQINIYGLSIETMTPLMRIQWNTMNAIKNTIRVEVGEKGDKVLSLAYEGNITFAKINMSNAPTTCLQIESQMAVVEALTPRDATTYSKGQDASEIIKEICNSMGYQYENNGASHILSDPVTLEGSYISRIQKLCVDCDFDLYTEQRYIAICPRGGSRSIKIPILTPSTGLRGYPSPDIRGLTFRCRFNPLVRFGGIVTIKDSLIPTANGDWRTYGVRAILESNSAQARWEMEVSAVLRSSKDVAIAR
ncbi:MAG: hypothetical protein [Caudoviricetes sp.]|nr:MAG: hypothetical protein [Caudoviricetes sp.]